MLVEVVGGWEGEGFMVMAREWEVVRSEVPGRSVVVVVLGTSRREACGECDCFVPGLRSVMMSMS